jgi:hypothetical protein
VNSKRNNPQAHQYQTTDFKVRESRQNSNTPSENARVVSKQNKNEGVNKEHMQGIYGSIQKTQQNFGSRNTSIQQLSNVFEEDESGHPNNLDLQWSPIKVPQESLGENPALNLQNNRRSIEPQVDRVDLKAESKSPEVTKVRCKHSSSVSVSIQD